MGKITEEKDVQQWATNYNKNTAEVIGPIDIQHAFMNWRTIRDEFKAGRAADLSVIADKCKGPAMLLGSGPSLDEAMPLLKDWKGAICCSTSQATTCCYYGRSPELIVMLDSQTPLAEFATDAWGKNSALVCNPSLAPDIMAYWKGPKFYYRQMDPSNPFYSRILPIAYPFIQTELLLFSCTPAAQLGILRNLGYNPIFLVGLDMGFPKGARLGRFTWWRYRETGGELHHGKWRPKSTRWVADPPCPLPPHEGLIRARNGVLTERVHLFFKRSICAVTVLETHRPDAPQIFNASKGILYDFPTVKVEDVVKQQGVGFEAMYRTNAEQRKVVEKYLVSQRMYVLNFKNSNGVEGCRFFETEDWKHTLPACIEGMKREGADVETFESVAARVEALEAEYIAEGGSLMQVTEPPKVLSMQPRYVDPATPLEPAKVSEEPKVEVGKEVTP